MAPEIDLSAFFGTVDVAATQKAAKDFENLTGSGARYFKLEKGVNRFVVCPPWGKGNLIVRQLGGHFNPATRVGFPCPEITSPGTFGCPVCYVYRLLAAAGTPRENIKELRFNTRSMVNCIPLVQGGNSVPMVKLAHVLEGSWTLGDFLNRNLKDFPDLTNMSNALPIQIEKTEENKRVSYTVTWWPTRLKVIETMEEATALAASLYNLDELAEGKWTKDSYDNAVLFANASLARFGMIPIPDFTGVVTPPTKEGKKKSSGAPGQGTPQPVVAAPVAAPTPVFVPQVPQPVVMASTPIAAVPAPSPETGMKRDGTNLDPGTGLPFCLGWHSPTDENCSVCQSMGPCIVQSMNRIS